jgi:hypothetical protein
MNTTIRGLQIKDAFFGDGLKRNAVDENIAEVALKANSGLEISSNEVAVKLDGATLAMGASGLKVSAIANNEISADASIDLDKIHDMADTKVMIGSGAGNAEYALSGDVTMGNTGITAIGATKVTDAMINDDVATGLAGVGLSATAGVLALDINELDIEATFDPSADYVALEDATDNGSNRTLWSVIATAIAGTGITATDGVLSAEAVANNIVEGDIQVENKSATCDDVEVDFTLSNTPIANSLQVFLNGLMQEEGSGKDYTVDGTTVTFAIAPETNDILIIHYIIDN